MPLDIFSLLNSVILLRALYVVALLNVPELLHENPLTIDQLNVHTRTNKPSLSRIMSYLKENNVFGINDDGSYFNNAIADAMRNNHPQTIKPFVLHDDETRWNSFGHLGYSIQTGKAAFDMLYGQDYFTYLQAHPELSSRFDEAMTIISSKEDDSIATTLSFEGIVADIGGGKGQLIRKIMAQHPDVKGLLFDLPVVIENLPKEGTITLIPGSFFEPLNFKADIFILKRILHDWEDAKAIQIVQNVAAAMNNDSRLFIFEGMLDCSKNKKVLSAIDLALLTIFEGKERTLGEITYLLSQANLKIINITEIDDIVCAIECKKSANSKGSTMLETTPAYLYKIVAPDKWQESSNLENLKLDPVDNEFIHFSTEEQLERILTKYWANRPYILLEVDTAQLPGQMKFETNPGGVAKYYHLYNGAIPLKAVKIVKK